MKKRFLRTILMIAGVLTVMVILLSQSFYRPIENNLARVKKEQKAGEQTGATRLSAPADVVPISAIQLGENIPTILKSLTSVDEDEKTFFPDFIIFTPYLKVLFRAIISPNAP